MSQEQIHVKFEGNTPSTVTFLHGQALPPREVTPIFIPDGTLPAPAEFIKGKLTIINQIDALVVVNREALSIEFKTDPRNFYSDTVIGSLRYSTIWIKLGINSGEYRTLGELADLFKMNRNIFASVAT